MTMGLTKVISSLFILNILFLLIVLEDIKHLPLIHTTLSLVTGINIGPIGTVYLLSILLFIIPQLSAVFILSTFKKYTFNHYKSISKSFYITGVLMVITYSVILLILLMEFIIRLAFKEEEFHILMESRLHLIYREGHFFTMNILTGLLFHTAAFIIGLLIVEMIIAANNNLSQMRVEEFYSKNKRLTYPILGIFLFYMLVILYYNLNLNRATKTLSDDNDKFEMIVKYLPSIIVNILSFSVYRKIVIQG